MIGGISGGYPALIPADRSSDQRGRAAGFSAPDPVEIAGKRDEQAAARRSEPQGIPNQTTSIELGSGAFEPRIEARPQAQAARLARYEEDSIASLPRQNQQALRTYTEVFGTRDAPEVDLVGLDLRA